MMRRFVTALGALTTLVALTAIVTWPQALHLATRIGAHDDPQFSIWRLGWIAHALQSDPGHLFDANIFYPARNTLTFSDAMLLEGLLGAPFIWAGVPTALVYNLLLFAGFVLSGMAMFVLAKHVTGQDGPALVAAAIFTVAPYRIDHFMHLELQWAMWMPLAFWAIHRTFERPSWRAGLLAGVFVWLQIVSSVYYGVFLAMTCIVLALALCLVRRENAPHAIAWLAVGGALAAFLTLPYAWPYIRSSALMVRRVSEVSTYSANLWNYLAGPPPSAFWGWTTQRFGGMELNLFPGLIAMLLALVSAFNPRRRFVVVYAVVLLLTIDLSLGLNGFIYRWLFEHLPALHGLRSPARFGILVSCAIAMLAALGAQVLSEFAVRSSERAASFVVPLLLVLIAVEGSTTGMQLMDVPKVADEDLSVYTAIRRMGPGPILELPLPRLDRLPGHDARFTMWSTMHWYPIVNGYSGYYPPEFVQTVVRTEHFPDDQSILQLTNIGVRYIVLHRAFYEDTAYRELLERVSQRRELTPLGTYIDPVDECRLFLLER